MNHHHRSTQVCTCSQGISQFYLHTHTFIRNRNEPYLPLPSQPQLVLIYRPRRDGLRLSRPRCQVGYFLTTKPMLGRSLFLLKNRFLCLVLPNLNRSGFFLHTILLYGIHLTADLDCDRRVDGSRSNRNDYVFVILVTHPIILVF